MESLDFAEMAGGDGEHTRTAPRGRAVNQIRDQLPAVPHAPRRRTRVHVLKDRAAERRGAARRLSGLAQTVDVVHHDRVSGIAARLGKGAVGEWILVQETANRMVQARVGVCRPLPSLLIAARQQIVEQLVQRGCDPPRLKLLVDHVQRRLLLHQRRAR